MVVSDVVSNVNKAGNTNVKKLWLKTKLCLETSLGSEFLLPSLSHLLVSASVGHCKSCSMFRNLS